MGSRQIKQPIIQEIDGVVSVSKNQVSNPQGNGTPTFCFRHLHSKYNMTTCCASDRKFPKALIKKIGTLSQMTWSDIQLSSRKGLGSEKITRSSLKVSVPSSISSDVQSFLSFYFAGTDGRLIGYRGADTLFHAGFIDTKLNVYNH